MSVQSFKAPEIKSPVSCAACGSLDVLPARTIRNMFLYGENPSLSSDLLAEWEAAFVYGVSVKEVNPSKLDGDV